MRVLDGTRGGIALLEEMREKELIRELKHNR